jgi:hypothetical protein
MIKRLLLVVLLTTPWGLNAKPILVRSGEHADFSRIVIQFETLRDWTFGRVENGYELRVDAPGASFDVSDVFKFIPRTRIATVSLPGPGRLTLDLACRCVGDAFEVRPGRLVVDIKSGRDRPNAAFEKPLPALTDGSPWIPKSVVAPGPPVLPFGGDLVDVGNKVSDPASPMNTPGNDPFPVLFLRLGQQADGGTRPDLPEIALPILFENAPRPTPAATPIAANHGVPPPRPGPPTIGSKPDTVQSPESNEQASSSPPWDPTDPFAAASATSERVAIAKSELLLQLARASTQGLVAVDPPDINFPTDIQTPVAAPANDKMSAEPAAIPAPTPRPPEREHLRIETVVDRDRPGENAASGLNMSGAKCLDPALFDVSSWGPQDFVTAPFGALRTNIVKEFDKPNPTAIVALARRYIFLGFGAEAKALVNSFDTIIPNSDILIDMSELMDFGFARTPGRMASQISCSTDGAMWAILSVSAIPKGADIDKRSVLRTFSALPPHLRQLLGPGLADRFLKLGDIDTATAVRDLIDRLVGDRDVGFKMLEAQLNAQEGNTDQTLKLLAQVSVGGGDLAGDAVVQLIETKLDTGKRIDKKTAQLADTLAVENRGTALGRRLTRAAILGFAVSGQVETTFERIKTAVENADVTPAEARELRARAHMQNARDSTDSMFLKLLFRHEPTKAPVTPAEIDAHRAVSERLVKLGLPDQALAMYANATFELGASDQRIFATADLAIGDGAAAYRELGDLQDAASQRLRASAEEMMGQYSQAVKIFAALGMSAELSSAAWRAGDWSAVASAGSSVRSQAAALVSKDGLAPSAGPNSARASSSAAEPIAFSRNLVSKSEKTRSIIQNLLK